jgi:hypothetical protein
VGKYHSARRTERARKGRIDGLRVCLDAELAREGRVLDAEAAADLDERAGKIEERGARRAAGRTVELVGHGINGRPIVL